MTTSSRRDFLALIAAGLIIVEPLLAASLKVTEAKSPGRSLADFDRKATHGNAAWWTVEAERRSPGLYESAQEILVDHAKATLPEGVPFELRFTRRNFGREFGMAWIYEPEMNDREWHQALLSKGEAIFNEFGGYYVAGRQIA